MTIMMLWIGFMYVFLSWYIKRPLSCKLIAVFIIEFMLMWIGARVKETDLLTMLSQKIWQNIIMNTTANL